MEFTREELEKIGISENIGIHDLRNRARDMGVKNPTAKKRKDDLIADMIAIKEGRLLPVVPSKRGRPPIAGRGNFVPVTDWASSVLEDSGGAPRFGGCMHPFDGFTPVYPSERLTDWRGCLCGQRVLIVSHEATDGLKTLEDFCGGVDAENLTSIFVDFSPEFGTCVAEKIAGKKVFSPLGKRSIEHIRAAELCLSEARRRAAAGEDVVLVVHFFDALYRAYREVFPADALTAVQKFFGMGRNLSEAGSLTLVAFVKHGEGAFLDAMCAIANKKVVIDRDERVEEERSF